MIFRNPYRLAWHYVGRAWLIGVGPTWYGVGREVHGRLRVFQFGPIIVINF